MERRGFLKGLLGLFVAPAAVEVLAAAPAAEWDYVAVEVPIVDGVTKTMVRTRLPSAAWRVMRPDIDLYGRSPLMDDLPMIKAENAKRLDALDSPACG